VSEESLAEAADEMTVGRKLAQHRLHALEQEMCPLELSATPDASPVLGRSEENPDARDSRARAPVRNPRRANRWLTMHASASSHPEVREVRIGRSRPLKNVRTKMG